MNRLPDYVRLRNDATWLEGVAASIEQRRGANHYTVGYRDVAATIRRAADVLEQMELECEGELHE